jgi:8-oxo-dGTP pyrophosphatase MutT (NUDIX family)
MTPAPPPPDGDDGATSGSEHLVLAAGGVVLQRLAGEHHVLVVHRPNYDDWSLPKGHVDAGESTAAAAMREVAEETGVEVRVVRELGTTEHPIGARRKRVHWFLMERTPNATEPAERAADAEVDEAAWWATHVAMQRLTYPADQELVRSAIAASVQDD